MPIGLWIYYLLMIILSASITFVGVDGLLIHKHERMIRAITTRLSWLYDSPPALLLLLIGGLGLMITFIRGAIADLDDYKKRNKP